MIVSFSKHFPAALRFALGGSVIVFLFLRILPIEAYAEVVRAVDVFAFFIWGLPAYTSAVSWAIYLFIIGLIKSIRDQSLGSGSPRTRKLSFTIAAVLHILVAGVFNEYTTKYTSEFLSFLAHYGQLLIAVSLIIWLVSEFSRARIFVFLSIIFLIFASLAPLQTIRSESKIERQIETFDINANTILGLSEPERAYENCGKMREIFRSDPSVIGIYQDVDAFERACFNGLAVKTKNPELCHPLTKTFPGDLAGCIYRIATRNKDPSLCYEHEDFAKNFEGKLRREGKWPYPDVSPRFNVAECLRIVATQEWYYTQ